jgi:excisionase family DNA binding protein
MSTRTTDEAAGLSRPCGGTNAPLAASPLMDIHTVAEVLCVAPRHIRRLVAERRIPYLKVGRFVRFDPGELDVWLDAQRVEVQRLPCRGTGPR